MAATQGGALAEFSKRPPGFKLAVFAGIAALLGLVYFQFMLRPLKKKYKQAQETSEELQQERDDLDAQLATINKMNAKRAVLEKQLEEDRKALPTEAELPSFFDTLNRKVGDAGVEVKRWEYKKEIPVEDFYRVPVEIELTGTFQQLKRFFSSLLPHDDSGAASELPQEKERIITIEDLSLSDPTAKNGEVVLTAKFTASTFRQDEAKKAAPAAGAASGAATKPPAPAAGSGAGTGSGTAPAKAPPTPGGNLGKSVKSDVDDSMKQSQDRAGSAKPDGTAKLKGGV